MKVAAIQMCSGTRTEGNLRAARALLEQMEARGFVIIDAQGHATFT